MITILPARVWMLGLTGFLLVGLLNGCGSSGPVVGQNIEKRVYLLENEAVDQPPEIIGGYGAVEKVKNYPSAAEEDDAFGVIWLQSTVSASGNATRVQLAEGGHPALETEALNVIQQIEFRPALKNGAPVPAQIQVPVIFQGPYKKNKKKKEKNL